MRRRDFIATLGSAAAATLPIETRAQRSARQVIGVLQDTPDTGVWSPRHREAFTRGLAEMGIENGDIVIDRRTGLGQRLREQAEDLVRQRVAVIATPGSTPAARAAQAATATIPIVFGIGFDPVQLGLVASLNQPGGNITGYTEMQVDVVSKRLELLHALVPKAAHYGALIDPRNPIGEAMGREAQRAAEVIGKTIQVISVGDDCGL